MWIADERKKHKTLFHTRTHSLIRIHYCWYSLLFFFGAFVVLLHRLPGQKKYESLSLSLAPKKMEIFVLFVLFGCSCFLIVSRLLRYFEIVSCVLFLCLLRISSRFLDTKYTINVLIRGLSCFALHSKPHTLTLTRTHTFRSFVRCCVSIFAFIYFKVWQHCTNQLFRISHLTRATITTTTKKPK